MNKNIPEYVPDLAALSWYVDAGADEALADEPIDRLKGLQAAQPSMASAPMMRDQPIQNAPQGLASTPPPSMPNQSMAEQARAMSNLAESPQAQLMGASEEVQQSVVLAKAADTLEDLREAIAQSDGAGLKKTAMNLVFADGNPKADLMIIGDAPEADDDRGGQAFVGASGQLMDKILAAIGLDRTAEEPKKSAYLCHMINYRPPGNRSLTAREIETHLPFIERHIQLVKPKAILITGGVAAKALLGRSESLSKLRKKMHDYTPITEALQKDAQPIPALVTFTPSYLIQTPLQKRAAWADVLMLKEKLDNL